MRPELAALQIFNTVGIMVVLTMVLVLAVLPAPSLNSSLSAFDEDCDVVDDYFGHEFEFLVVSSC